MLRSVTACAEINGELQSAMNTSISRLLMDLCNSPKMQSQQEQENQMHWCCPTAIARRPPTCRSNWHVASPAILCGKAGNFMDLQRKSAQMYILIIANISADQLDAQQGRGQQAPIISTLHEITYSPTVCQCCRHMEGAWNE